MWPEAEFEEAARQERDDDMNELEKLSQEQEKMEVNESNDGLREQPLQNEPYICPICSLPQPCDDATFNSHIDFCLSRQTIKEAVKSTAPSAPSPKLPALKPAPAKGKGKRGRPKKEDMAGEKAREKRRAFFSNT